MDAHRTAGTLLTTLINTANACGDATQLLHESVTLHRLDGTSLSGRSAVVDAICNRGSEAQFSVVGSYAESIHVAIEIEGIPGRVVFIMSASVSDGLLTEIWMD